MSQFTVDVIVNNYNYARYLRDAIDSALAQTHPHVRVIVVDDGSTDDSREVIASYGDEILAVFKENGGQASALNAGFDHSSGEAVVFLDADDILAPDIAERIAAAFSADSTLAKVHYPMEVIDGRGRRTGVRKPPPHIPLRSGDIREQKLAFPFDVPWMATSGNAFARWSLNRVFPIPEEDFALLADWYLNHLVPLLGRVSALEAVGAYYRVHGQNTYELAEAKLDLDHVRRTIDYADRVRPYLANLARGEGLRVPGGAFVSVSDIANRLISIRLDRDRHPIRGDTVARLLASSVRAVARRFDIRWPMKVLFLMWFAAMAVAPRPFAYILAERFVFPQRREMLNRLLARLHRSDRGTAREPS